ncbi:MAG: hypothetical protein P8Q85_02675 [Candidatus Poseidoniaceae archaeon]|nr:hypothetical protein [Candidatus Poseidoniaceae archaeon]MDG1557376.1 hypothetical protein [Candidatus Poseidoniaceae archaeon]
MRVLDTAALLHWPVDQLADGVCAISQQAELERVSPQRSLLVQSLDSIEWRDVPPAWLQEAKEAAASSGDLPRLSDVDVDVLALAIALDATLVTDDYRLQNTMQALQRPTKSVGTTGAKQVWRWELRCTGCRATSPVPANVDRSKKGSVAECDVCGSPMNVKRAR